MPKKICVIDGHPDPDDSRLIHALCDEYCAGATKGGHEISRIDIARLDCKPLKYKSDFDIDPDSTVQRERAKLITAEHVVLMFPLWLGSMPAATRAFFEQMARGEFFLEANEDAGHKWPKRMMKGKSARIVVTMGMPAIAYKTLFAGASLKAVERGLFGISGFKPVRHTVLGNVDGGTEEQNKIRLSEIRALGVQGK